MSVTFISHAKEALAAEELARARALEIIGGKAETYAKKICPVDTGRLRDSITHAYSDDSDHEVILLVGTNVEYAPYVELGHKQQPGRFVPKIKKRLKRSWVPGKPFLRPAIENHRTEIEQLILNELNNA